MNTKKSLQKFDILQFTQSLLYLKAATWFTLSAIYFITLYHKLKGQIILIIVISILMFGNGIVLLALAYFTKKKIRFIYYGTIAYMLVNIILSFADQFGLADMISLLIDVAIVVLLIRGKKEFIKV